MKYWSHEFFHICVWIALSLLIISILLVFLRLLNGPTLADRVIALDLTTGLTLCLITVFTIIANRAVYLDIVVTLALMGFLITVAFAQFIEWQLGKGPYNE